MLHPIITSLGIYEPMQLARRATSENEVNHSIYLDEKMSDYVR